MESYQDSPQRKQHFLSQQHRRMLFDESGLAPGVVAERGYRTIRSRAEILDFPKWQRRLGLYVPMFSPDDITQSSQLRPNKPRRDGPKYETPGGSDVIVDVHPRMMEAVRDPARDLWITEGAKKGDALMGASEDPVLSLAGVWMWCVPKARPYKLKPCFDHVPLKGRTVRLVFDSDAMTKGEVQQALAALVEALERRGAEVLVVYLQDADDGSKVGVDDYLVAGGTVNELKMLARKFEPADIGKIRLSKDAKLRGAVADLERRFGLEEWKGMGGHSDRDVALKLIEAAKRNGKVVADGIHVVKAQGPLALEAKVNSRTLWKSLNRLEKRGFCYRDNEGRKHDEAGAFVLRASVSQVVQSKADEGNVTQGLQAYGPGDLHLRAGGDTEFRCPRLRWSKPKLSPKRGTVDGTRKVRQGPKLEARDGITRLGKIRGAIIDVLDRGGPMDINELAAAVHKRRGRDLVRRKTTAKGYDGPAVMLEDAGIITVEDGRVSLTDNWLEAVEDQRQLGGEIEAEEVARRRYENKSRAFHNPDQVKATSHWTNNPDADGTVEDLEPADMLRPVDVPVVAAIIAFEKRYGRGSFKWNNSGCKELFYTFDEWPDPDQLERIRGHIEAA